jgi:abequosyltransferase
MAVFRELPVLQPDQVFAANLANKNERTEWFQRAVTNEAFFSFISGLIVRREKWKSGELPEAYCKSCWGHVARYFGLVSSGLTVCYVAEIWLDQRGDNDSFADKGIVNRFRIGIEGYHKLADGYFGHGSIEAFHIRRVIRNEFTFLMLLNAKILCVKNPMREDRQVLDELVRIIYCDNLWTVKIKRSIYFATPYWLVAAARFAYQPIKRIRQMLNNV